MPYIANNKISKSPIPNSVEVSDAEYSQAMNALTNGQQVFVHNGEMIITSKPEKKEGHKDPVWGEELGDWYHEVIPEPTPEPQTPKEIRDDALRNLTHDFGDGRVIQVRPADFSNDELNIRNAIERMKRLGLTQQPWVMVDNTSHMVTVAELEEAIVSGQDQGAAIWQTYIEAIQ